jgi:hypothetical protein
MCEDEMRDVQDRCRDEVERLDAQWTIKLKEIEADRRELEAQLVEQESTIEQLQRENDDLRARLARKGLWTTSSPTRTASFTRSTGDGNTSFPEQTAPSLARSFTARPPVSEALPRFSPRRRSQDAGRSEFVDKELERAEEAFTRRRPPSPPPQLSSFTKPVPSPAIPITEERQKSPQKEPSSPPLPPAASPRKSTVSAAATTSGGGGSWLDDGPEEDAASELAARLAKDRAEREAKAMREIQEAMEAQRREQQQQPTTATATEITEEGLKALDELEELAI